MNKRFAHALGLFGFLMALYFATYSAHPISGDENIMLDGAHSFYRNGSLELAYFNDLRPYFPAPPNRIVLSMDVEPLQSYAAAALMWIAAQLPRIGLVHAAWTLNLWVTALTAVLLYDFGIVLGYSDRTAFIVALLFGVATIAWPYSELFFREPLFTLLALACANFLTRLRHRTGLQRWIWLLLAGGAFAGALLTKGIALLLIPSFIILVTPRPSRQAMRNALLTAIVVFVTAMCLFFLYQRIAPGVRYRFAATWLSHLDLTYIGVALPAWLISPGFSLWVFSPVLLLGLVGAYLLWREGRYRELAFPLVLSGSLMLGYVLFQGQGWYSGLGWGPRYLVPLTPFLALWLLPVAKRSAYKPKALIAIGIVAAVSSLIQVLAVYVPTETFSAILNNQSITLNRQILPWQDGVWTLAYTPLVTNLQQITRVPSQIAWIVNHTGAVVVPMCLLTACLSLLALARNRLALLAVAAVPITIYVGLTSFYADPRFGGDNPTLWQALDRLNSDLRPTDAILLNDNAYRSFFINYYKGHAPIYMLPIAPGESATPDEAPEVVSDNSDRQVHPYTWTLLSRLEQTTSRWWFITEFNPYSPNRTRANEHFLVRHFFPVGEIMNTDLIRLIEIAPFTAPPEQITPQNPLDVDYGAARLVGFDLPRGDEFKAGAVVPISLLWRHENWPADLEPFDYGVNVSLINSNGAMITQHAGIPIASFGLMSQWVKGKRYRDNDALILPTNLPQGTYQLWVSVYDWRTARNLPVQNARTDHSIVGQITVIR